MIDKLGWALAGLLCVVTSALCGAAVLVIVGWPRKATDAAWRAGYERGWREHAALTRPLERRRA